MPRDKFGAPVLPDGVFASISHKDDIAVGLVRHGSPGTYTAQEEQVLSSCRMPCPSLIKCSSSPLFPIITCRRRDDGGRGPGAVRAQESERGSSHLDRGREVGGRSVHRLLLCPVPPHGPLSLGQARAAGPVHSRRHAAMGLAGPSWAGWRTWA